jgi:hypothetical protein
MLAPHTTDSSARGQKESESRGQTGDKEQHANHPGECSPISY